MSTLMSSSMNRDEPSPSGDYEELGQRDRVWSTLNKIGGGANK
jgi:hypothetical protein